MVWAWLPLATDQTSFEDGPHLLLFKGGGDSLNRSESDFYQDKRQTTGASTCYREFLQCFYEGQSNQNLNPTFPGGEV